VRALLKCGEALAREIVEVQRPELDAFAQAADRLLAPQEQQQEAHTQRKLSMPQHFHRLIFRAGGDGALRTQSAYAQRFLAYLRERGFEHEREFAERYDLHYSLAAGPWQWRLVIPFREADELVGWTARALDPRAQVRYLTLPSDAEAARRLGCTPALVNMDSYVWGYSELERASEASKRRRCLIVVEGPMDVLKLQWYNPTPAQVGVTCCFGMPKPEQVYFLGRALRGFERGLVLLDSDAYGQGLDLADELEELSSAEVVALSIAGEYPGTKDPGELGAEQVRDLVRRWA